MYRKLFKITAEEALEHVLEGKIERLYVCEKGPANIIHLALDARIEIDEINKYLWYFLER